MTRRGDHNIAHARDIVILNNQTVPCHAGRRRHINGERAGTGVSCKDTVSLPGHTSRRCNREPCTATAPIDANPSRTGDVGNIQGKRARAAVTGKNTVSTAADRPGRCDTQVLAGGVIGNGADPVATCPSYRRGVNHKGPSTKTAHLNPIGATLHSS